MPCLSLALTLNVSVRPRAALKETLSCHVYPTSYSPGIRMNNVLGLLPMDPFVGVS
jgi:hypothetical protein